MQTLVLPINNISNMVFFENDECMPIVLGADNKLTFLFDTKMSMHIANNRAKGYLDGHRQVVGSEVSLQKGCL